MKVQSLEKLQNRKSELITHLQNERGMVTGSVSGARSTLDRVLATRPRPGMDVLNSSLNDTFVAMRTTNTLDDLVEPTKGDYMNTSPKFGSLPTMSTKAVMVSEMLSSEGRVTLQQARSSLPNTSISITSSSQTMPATSRTQMPGQNLNVGDLTEDGESREEAFNKEMTRLVHAKLENEDEFFIPFDPPLVSKFGPISRSNRIKVSNTDPVQVTAEENTKCRPVLAVERPYPTSAPVPSMFNPQISACPSSTLATSVSTPANIYYSPWSGKDFWRWKIPEIVHKLEKSAIQANTTSERLALQLQSVELQISMKTGESPKPVSTLLQEAVGSPKELLHLQQEAMGKMYMPGEERGCVLQRREYLPEGK